MQCFFDSFKHASSAWFGVKAHIVLFCPLFDTKTSQVMAEYPANPNEMRKRKMFEDSQLTATSLNRLKTSPKNTSLTG